MQVQLVVVGKTKESYLAAGIVDFQQRLSRFVRLNIVTVKEKRWSKSVPAATIKQEEGRALLARIQPSYLVVLDPAGRQASSEELADLLRRWENEGRKMVTFVIGGPLGVSDTVRRQGDLSLSLSAMTFTHEMSRLILLEQLYRAYSIKANTGYHK